MSAPEGFTPLKGVEEILSALPSDAFAGTPLASVSLRERALSLLCAHDTMLREAERLRSALAALCAIPADAAALDQALAPDLAPLDGLRLLAANTAGERAA
ncbi:hypothetical protein SAMN06297129_3985 [Pseudooceanicola antarcticus]|uniref:Uncharacterized protein n=1 Tax=Pseudooceanicola antarcticus TaxID=1247613 RepID=A0A285JKP6_9RHOB|nr:hypothetical protein [Pseudooceanicola antarcticus]PJE26504.1 hypothetical protein CVM39_17495 [Pseudooceanicola antarcticus]SNY60838.1 hypothetical protein SAMN06297129_3985 [Pseudooceanicola antarcticus]